MKKFAYLLAGAVAVVGMALGSAYTAGASATRVQYSQYLAGFAGGLNGQQTFAAIEDQVTAPDEPASVPANSVAVGIVLQNLTTVASPTVGEALVWKSTSGGTCADGGSQSDQWTVEYGFDPSGAPGVPLKPSALTPVPDAGDIICVPAGQQYYQEIYYSTKLHLINFFAGTREPGFVAYQAHLPFFFSTPVLQLRRRRGHFQWSGRQRPAAGHAGRLHPLRPDHPGLSHTRRARQPAGRPVRP